MRLSLALVHSTLHFYSVFLDNPAPPGCPDELWDRLLARAVELYSLAAQPVPVGDDGWLRLRELTRRTQHCLDLLIDADMRAPIVQCAWGHLRMVVSHLGAGLESMSTVLLN